MRIFDNIYDVRRSVIERRIQALDPDAVVETYSVLKDDGTVWKYVKIDSVLLDEQVLAILYAETATDAAEETEAEQLREFLKAAREHFLSLKARFDRLETWAKTKGYTT